MYEIWLVSNIVWEMAVGLWPVIAGALLIWLAIMAAALARPGARWRAALPWAAGMALAASAVAALLLPGLSRSSLAELAYWVDWANLLAMAAGVGAVVAAFVWPLAAMRAAAR